METDVIHGFVGRLGGVSRGLYESMNLSHLVGDDPSAVDANWERLRSSLPQGLSFVRLKQVHGNAVHVVTHRDAAERPEGDGMVTDQPGVVLGIFTADCVPILMAAADRGIVCALHAGWRGVIGAIAENGVGAMEEMGADRAKIRVAMGPSIGPCCFEVDAGLAERFADEIPGSERHARAGKPGKAYLDLRGIVRDQLIAAGVPAANVANAGPCTRCASDKFFSRRAAGGITSGLQLSFIGLPTE